MEGWGGALCSSTQTDDDPSSTTAEVSAAAVAAGAVLVDGGVPSHDVAATMVGATIMERIAKVRCSAAASRCGVHLPCRSHPAVKT